VHATCTAFRSPAVTRGHYTVSSPFAIVRTFPSLSLPPLPPPLSLSLFYLTPMDCLMTRPWCRQRGALRAALFLLPRAFYRHPLLIAVVPHRLRHESIYHHQHYYNHHRHHHHIATLHRRNPLVYARGVSRLKSATDCTNFSLAARARFENASGFGPAINSRTKLISYMLHKLFKGL